MKLIGGEKQEHIQAMEELTLDDLYAMASVLGEVEIGGIGSKKQASVNANFTGSDYLTVRCSKYDCVKRNLSEVISRCRLLSNFYKTI